MKKMFIRVLLVWLFLGQMFFVCLTANTTVSLSHLESAYAFKPSAENKSALDNEFDRVANFESRRAIARFASILALDVAVILFYLNFVARRKSTRNAMDLPPQLVLSQTAAN